MKFLTLAALGLVPAASAHTLFTTFFINGKNQGDGTCVRQPTDGSTSTSPIYPLTGDVMACGRDGEDAVPFVCPASAGDTVSFEFRSWPNAEKSGSIDPSHKGPCAVYLKKVDDMFSDAAAGDGWFKIWDDGYNADTGKWCVDTLIDNGGLLSVELPTGLPSGYYLARPELLALHSAPSGDPQFYHSCAQIFIEQGAEGSLSIPSEYAVSIPGHVKADDPGLTFNLYVEDAADYVIPGPPVYVPASTASGTKRTLGEGAIPSDCLLKNGNWCAKPVPSSSDVTTCWASVENCWDQSKVCWDTMQPSGGWNCEVWADYCTAMGKSCEAGNYDGPPEFAGKEVFKSSPEIPAPYNVPEGTVVKNPAVPDKEEPAPTEAATTTRAPTSAPTSAPTATATAVPEEEKPTTPPPQTDDEESEDDSSSNEEPGLSISLDGRCGGTTGQTCVGSSFGDCCSKKGRCGRKTRHCTCGCQKEFGNCRK